MLDVTPSQRSAPTRSRGVLVAFIVVALILPLELLVQWRWSEPYPALTQPAFSFAANPLEVPDALPKTQTFVTVVYSDGSSREFTAAELVGWTAGINQSEILREGILLRDDVPQPTIDWLRDRIAAVSGGDDPVSATIRLEFYRVDAHSLETLDKSVTRTLDIALEPGT